MFNGKSAWQTGPMTLHLHAQDRDRDAPPQRLVTLDQPALPAILNEKIEQAAAYA